MRSVNIKELKSVVGEKMTIKLCEAFAGRKCYFPKILKEIDDETRNKHMVEAANAGETYESIAERYNLSLDWVRHIIADGKT